MSLLRQAFVLLILAAALAGGWWWQVRDAGGAAGTGGERFRAGGGIPVVVESVPMLTDVTVLEAVGTGRAARSITVYPPVAGTVAEMLFEAGDAVAAGAPLVRLDDADEAAAVDLGRVAVEQAEQVLRRYEQAQPTGAVSDLEVDAARTDLRRAELELRRAEIAFDERTVRAPFAGTPGIPQVDVGDRIGPDQPIATLDDRSTLEVDFDVPEAFAGRVRPGDPVTLTAWSLPDRPVQGTVASIGSRLDPESRTLPVRATMANPEDRFLPGMSFAIDIRLEGRRWPGVPEVAVLWDRDGAYIWRLKEGVADRVPVRIVRRDGAWILVDAALEEGELVVAEGVQRVRQGAPLTIVEDGATAVGPPAAPSGAAG